MNKITDSLRKAFRELAHFRKLLFLVLVAGVYGFVVMRIITLRNEQPDQSAVSSAETVSQPNIDKATVDKIKQLQDNSVNIRALFTQARQNPFQE